MEASITKPFCYDFLGYIDGTNPAPLITVNVNDTITPNSTYSSWLRQDQLILNALIGSLSLAIIPFITCVITSHEAWAILTNAYAKP